MIKPPETFFVQLWIGGIRLKKLFKNHCTASLLTVITGFLVLVAISVWGMGMYCLTSVTAEYAASRYLAGYGDFASTIAQRCFESRLGKAGSSKYKNLEKSLLWKAVDTGGGAGSFNGARFIVGEGGGFLSRQTKTSYILHRQFLMPKAAFWNAAGRISSILNI